MRHNDTAKDTAADAFVRVENLKQHFPITRGIIFSRPVGAVRAVDDISFEIPRGETLGLVGESGCGKSTTGRSMLRLYEPTAGSVTIDGISITELSRQDLRNTRPKMQMIFQDSYSSLNPRHSVAKIIAEPLVIQNRETPETIRKRVADLLDMVGLDPDHGKRFPHEFSGGQRQRVGIARALALNPEFVVCDEPISALDVAIQAQVVNLLARLQRELGLTYLFIAHDLSMVRHISHRIAVMYLGKIMELARYDELFQNPLHPYTQSLMSAVPIPDPEIEKSRTRLLLKGDVPSPASPPPGCVFSTRCPFATERCSREVPQPRQLGPEHTVACHNVDDPVTGPRIRETGEAIVSSLRQASSGGPDRSFP
ncbi:oligopeptide transport system ATP-binding protein [Alkalispirochaeta americana]|uniref:Oligopeptide transport system ATP-binding protein n=1 Tax=Alkalispirochaeta americana TaxID=159291 RepID=A0A1N6NA11_9SPIO|nr:oligopeptide/dipeptide ABC transporter ATP-binding protein [Alkalispirochaeta americana]SIP88876.1 oligopeptide transport system ATP-binding protein [Alkalispirochaeta americana]